jgi:pSer/pThr/pTyr-binding forkhead associated (FHA) protein
MAEPQASLMIRGGPNSGMTVPLSTRPVTLGRRSDNDIVVDASTVSRRHDLIMETPSGFALRDLNTTNGTFVNQEDIGRKEHTLQHGDSIRLAGSEIAYVFRQEGRRTVKMQIEPEPTGVIRMDRFEAKPVEPEPDPEPAPELDLEPDPAMSDKESALLALLESRQGNVVSRQDIAKSVWPELTGGAHADLVIEHSIERIRAHLGDDTGQPVRLISVGEFGFLLL